MTTTSTSLGSLAQTYSRELLQFGFAGLTAVSLYLAVQCWKSRTGDGGSILPRNPTFFADLARQGDEPGGAKSKKKERTTGKAADSNDLWKVLHKDRVEGEAELVRLMLPDDANPAGNVHGGTILRLIEQVGWIVAARHANSGEMTGLTAVTTRIEQMDFHEPVFIGEVVTLTAKLAFSSSRSMMVVVKVSAENSKTLKRRLTNTAVLWYVALNPGGSGGDSKVALIPAFVPKTDDEREMYARGEAMYSRRKARLQEEEAPSPDKGAAGDEDPDRYPKDPSAFSPRESRSQLVQLMLPSDCTERGVVQGGVIMKLMDNAAGCVAFRHCRTNVVTISLEAMDFRAPVFNGDLVFVNANLNFVSQKSMEIEIVVVAENMTTGKKTVTNTGYFKFVSLDAQHKTIPVRPLLLETKEDVRNYLQGKKRYEETRKTRAQAK